tara:strand:- start:581 stop:892 length:312 start_codon:yes stop_codon:yes gene_type:complete
VLSPTARSLKKLRDEGWKPWVVEVFNHFTKKRKDLFNVADIIAYKDNEILLVQATSASNVSARVKKIAESEHIDGLREAGFQIEVWGWRKSGNKWVCRQVDCS